MCSSWPQFLPAARELCKIAQMSGWPDLQILHAIAATGSLSGAGRMLGVRHTTVGRRLDELERRMGGRLVDRMPRGAVLTPLGRNLADVAAGIDDLMATASRKARGVPGLIEGAVSITAPPLLCVTVLAPGLAPLLQRHPGLSLTVESSTILASLFRSEADIALRLGDPVEPSLLARRIGTVRLALYSAAGLPTLPQQEWRFIGYSASLSHMPHHRWFEEFVAGRQVVFRTNDVHTHREASASGIGIAMLPRALADSDRRLARIAEYEPPERPIWLLVHPDVRRSPAVGTVIDHLTALFASDDRFSR